MKIAILGTSNSVRKNGYAPIYRSIEAPNIVENFSIGSNMVQYGQLALEKFHILDEFDYVVTDFCLNDELFLERNTISCNWLYNEVYNFMLKIKQSGCKQIDLIFYRIDWDYSHIARRIHIQVCKELDIPYIDVMAIHDALQIKRERAFDDPAHLNFEYAAHLAYVIKRKRENYQITDSNIYIYNELSKKYAYFSLEDVKCNENKKILCGSAQYQSECILLDENEKIIIECENSYFEGFLLYNNINNDFLTIKTENCIYNKYVKYILTNLFYFYSIVSPVYIENKLEIILGKDSRGELLPLLPNDFFTEEYRQCNCTLGGFLLSKYDKSYLLDKENLPYYKENNLLDQNNYSFSYNVMQHIGSITDDDDVLFDYESFYIACLVCKRNQQIKQILTYGIKLYNSDFLKLELVQMMLSKNAKIQTENSCFVDSILDLFAEKYSGLNSVLQLTLIDCFYKNNKIEKALELVEQNLKEKNFSINHIIFYLMFCKILGRIPEERFFMYGYNGKFSHSITMKYLYLLDLYDRQDMFKKYILSYITTLNKKCLRQTFREIMKIKFCNGSKRILLFFCLIKLKKFSLFLPWCRYVVKSFFYNGNEKII